MTLRDLYQSHEKALNDFLNSFVEQKVQGPLLIDSPIYSRQPMKLLVVGQETNGWSSHRDIDAQFETYRDFNLGTKWNGPFWNITRKVESILGVERCSCAWSNLNRFDQNGGPPTGSVLEAMPTLDFLLKEEIKVLRPDICLFFTNRKYDDRLRHLYPGLQFSDIQGLPSSHFARLDHDELPRTTIRTPHPKSIRLNHWEEGFLDFIRTQSTAA